MKDQFQRTIDYARISITDRCNLYCTYCRPDHEEMLSHGEILRYEEILRVCKILTTLGIDKFKITGGEPLVRKGCSDFIRELKKTDGVNKVTLTTNGILLSKDLVKLAEAGVDGINISLDFMDQEKYKKITGFDGYKQVISVINKAVNIGLNIKINKLPVAAIPRARTLGDTNGVFKVVVDADTDKILGCTLFGPDSSEVINLVTMAMKTGQEYTFLRDFIFTHPSMSEALNDLMNF